MTRNFLLAYNWNKQNQDAVCEEQQPGVLSFGFVTLFGEGMTKIQVNIL